MTTSLILVNGFIKEVKNFWGISLDRVAEYLFEYLGQMYDEELIPKQSLDDVMDS